MKSLFITMVLIFYLHSFNNAQSASPVVSESSVLKWHPFEEGMKLARKKHKPVIVDIYTDWCGWCKKMDNETFQDPLIVSYLTENFIAIKLNAEGKEPIAFNGTVYTNPKPANARSTHQLAIALAGARLSYPTYIYLDSKGNTITGSAGYSQPEDLLPLLKYIGSDAYKSKTWKEFTGLK